MRGLVEHLSAAAADHDVRVVVLTGEGGTFCAGADLAGAAAADADSFADTGPRALVAVLETMLLHPKPIVARVQGHVAGGGNGLVAAADLAVAAESAKFAFSEVRVGVAPAVISVVCLARMTPAHARELLLTGERVTAHRVREAGLVTAVAEDDALDAVVASYVGQLLLGGPEALTPDEGAAPPRAGHAARRGVHLDRGAVRDPLRRRRGARGDERVPPAPPPLLGPDRAGRSCRRAEAVLALGAVRLARALLGDEVGGRVHVARVPGVVADLDHVQPVEQLARRTVHRVDADDPAQQRDEAVRRQQRLPPTGRVERDRRLGTRVQRASSRGRNGPGSTRSPARTSTTSTSGATAPSPAATAA